MSEYHEQSALIQWARSMQGQYPELRYLFHIPNGGWRHKATAGRMKAQGVRPGVPDLFLPIPRPGLWLEMKYGTNQLTAHQSRWCRALHDAGYHVMVCWSTEEAIAAIERYLNERKSDSLE